LAEAGTLAAIALQVRQSLWGSRSFDPLDQDHRDAHAKRETDNGLEDFHRPSRHHIAATADRERPDVRTFTDGSLYVADG
jgi:hypothetical protein